MAIFNEILSGRFNRSLQKAFAIKGSPPVRQLGGEIMPVHGLLSGVENRYLESWHRFGMVLSVVAAAGNPSEVQLRNSGNPNRVIAVIEKINVINQQAAGASVLVNKRTTNADLVIQSPTVAAALDSRGNPQPNLLISTSNVAAEVGTRIMSAALPANQGVEIIFFEDQEIPIVPGDAVMVVCGIVNNGITVNIVWRERVIEESELV
jgi:hypothetical protein